MSKNTNKPTAAEVKDAEAAEVKAAKIAEAELEAAEKSANAKASKAQSVGLVKMSKDGKTISVHPTCVEAHGRKGWVS